MAWTMVCAELPIAPAAHVPDGGGQAVATTDEGLAVLGRMEVGARLEESDPLYAAIATCRILPKSDDRD